MSRNVKALPIVRVY